MQRLFPLAVLALMFTVFAACGGGSSKSEPTSAPVATTTKAASAGLVTPRPSAISPSTPAGASPFATTTSAPGSSPTAVPATATTAAPATNPPATQPPATQAPEPTDTPTQPAQSGNPTSASVSSDEVGTYHWSPSTVSVAPGGSVTFSWSGGAAHNVTVPALGFTGPIGVSDSETITFPSPGTYQFNCEVHPTTMKGKVIVG